MPTDPGPTVARAQMMNRSQTPVASSRPTKISMAPPSRVTHLLLRRIAWCKPDQLAEAEPKDEKRQAQPQAVGDGQGDRPGGGAVHHGSGSAPRPGWGSHTGSRTGRTPRPGREHWPGRPMAAG